MRTVAITGARGFVGGHTVVEFEANGYHVVRIGRGPDGTLARIDDPGATSLFAGVDITIHLASQLSTGSSSLVTDYLSANVALTESVVLASIDAGVGRLISASSRLVYPAGLGRPARESDVGPDSAYGLSKWFAEQVVNYHANRTGLAATSLRLAQLIGSGDGGRGVVASFIRAGRQGGPLEVHGRGEAVRDVLDVRDAARAIRLAAEAPVLDSAINIGAGGRTIQSLALETAAAFGLAESSVHYVETSEEDKSDWSLNTSRASAQLGWAPQYSIAEMALDHTN